MATFADSLSVVLVCVSLFDREVNCRRAAASAFQESVGRQHQFSKGIDIIQLVDFFSVVNRMESFVNVSFEVAKFVEYRRGLIDHLVKYKVYHWDVNIRQLASQSIAKIATLEAKFVHDFVLPKLIADCFSNDLNSRHGAIVTIASILLSTYHLCPITPQRQHEIVSIIPQLEKEKLYRGKGGEIIRSAMLALIESIAILKISLNITINDNNNTNAKSGPFQKSVPQIYQDFLDDNLKHPNEDTQEMAVKSLKQFFLNCYSYPPKKAAYNLVERYLKTFSTSFEMPYVRRGLALALGVLPAAFILGQNYQDSVIDNLIKCSEIESNSQSRDAESRRNAVRSIVNVVENVGLDNLNQIQISKIWNCLIKAMQDYSIDNRGDVGRFVREQALDSLKRLTVLILSFQQQQKTPQSIMNQDKTVQLFNAILQQCVEKIDNIRVIAGKILAFFLYPNVVSLQQLEIPQRKFMESLFPHELLLSSDFSWGSMACTFSKFSSLLAVNEFRHSLLLGFIASVGGLNKSPVIDTNNDFIAHLIKLSSSEEFSMVNDTTILFFLGSGSQK